MRGSLPRAGSLALSTELSLPVGSAAGGFSAGCCQCRATITWPKWGAKNWGQGNQNAESAKKQHPRSILVAAEGRGDVLHLGTPAAGHGAKGIFCSAGSQGGQGGHSLVLMQELD